MPLVSVLLAVHNGDRYLGLAVESILNQTLADLELVLVDDASTDETPGTISRIDDPRLVVVTNGEQLGLAASLNRGLDHTSGAFVARLDADDVARPQRLERQVEALRARPGVAAIGSAVADLDADGIVGRTHVLPEGATALRWHALFSSPFFHPTVLVDRQTLDDHGLRYDPSYLESEDYDLWTRLFAFADGANLAHPLVLKRVHAGQASLRRRDVQEDFQRRVALREIARVAPGLSARDAELAWLVGSSRGVPGHSRRAAGDAFRALLDAFESVHDADRDVSRAAAKRLARSRLPLPALRIGRRRAARQAADPVRVTVVSPEPTPYRSPLFDRIAARDDIDLTVIYAARTVAGRTWTVEPRHRSVFLSGLRLPGAHRLVRHDYPLTPGIARALRDSRPDAAVVSGWSTFASQAAIAWCRAHRIPYVLHVESHDLDPRPLWRRAVKGAVASRAIRGAASVLAVGSAARTSALGRGASTVRVFANTIDVQRWIDRAAALDRSRHDGVVVLSVGRAVPEKGFDVLIRACAEAGVQLEMISGGLPENELAQHYVNADVFALLSRHEPWGVVVNEAAASGLPLVLSDRVGAAHDLLRDGENGFLVPAEDTAAAARALRRLADDPDLRRTMGERSRELVRQWGYEPSVEAFVAAVRDATSR